MSLILESNYRILFFCSDKRILISITYSDGAFRTHLELKPRPKVDPLRQSEKLIGLRNSLDFLKNVLKSPQMAECTLTL